MNLVQLGAIIILIGVLATGFAYASGLSVTSQDVGAGNAEVVSCDNAITYEFLTPVYDESSSAYRVGEVRVSGILQPACSQAGMTIVMTDENGDVLGEESISNIFTFTSMTFPVSDIILLKDVYGVHVALVK